MSTNARGIIVLRPRYFAHPDRRDPAYMAEQIRLKGVDRANVAEGEKWDAPAGTPYCPRFAEATREVSPWRFEGRYVADAPAIWPNLLWLLLGLLALLLLPLALIAAPVFLLVLRHRRSMSRK